MSRLDQDTLRQTTTLPGLLDLLCDFYDWPLETANLEEVTFDFTPDELAITDKEAVGVREIKQLRPLTRNQPWGVFFLDFERKRLPVGVLRRILRSLVKRKRERADRAQRASWALEDLLFICSHKAESESGFTFVHFTQPTEANRAARLTSFGWTPSSHNRTVLEFNLPALRWPDEQENAESWRKSWLGAFDKEKLTQVFYDDYERLFKAIRRELSKKENDPLAHEYSLQLLNRMMFMYFIQRKGWIGDDNEFLRSFWKAYKDTGQPEDAFHEKWLGPLFFKALNNPVGRVIDRHFPDSIRHALQLAPYLNGGLFTKNKLDDLFHGKLSDGRFEKLFDFLDHYNFTISEDTPLDIEVAVDTEMLGRVYENLVNTDETTDERGQAGIFYTPRIEIDLMCRLALVDNMANNLGDKHKNLFYELVFAIEESDKVCADAAITKKDLWVPIDEYLRKVTVLDPACGSGSFLVGMLNILNDLCKRANKELHRRETEYQRKQRIIGDQLYGVDVKHWAVHIAELRLWLNLIIESRLDLAERTVRKTPLLPNLTFKVQPGDSLVQEIGGFSLANLTETEDIGPALKKRIKSHQQTKVDYFRGNTEKDKTDARVLEIRKEELALFRDVLKGLENAARTELKEKEDLLSGTKQQKKMFDEEDEASRQSKKFGEDWRKRKEELEQAIETIGQARESLRETKVAPFVWDIAFVEVFGGDSKGFDIVIGNPPYVRQESISDPMIPRDKVTPENKKEYKTKLIRSVYAKYPWFFGNVDKPSRKIDAKSDLYIYFYFHGLSLLNPKGTFCFITSNSWLDTDYGKDLQEFLLRQSRVRMILDNTKRSFANADVNTVIALLGAPAPKLDYGLPFTARFVMFRMPFEHALSAVVFEEIEETKDRKATKEYRVSPLSQGNTSAV